MSDCQKTKTREQSVVNILRFLIQCGVLVLVAVGFTPLFAAQVQGVRLAPATDHTRVVIDLSSPVGHQLMTLDAPERLVIDLPKTDLPPGFKLPKGSGVIDRMRSGKQKGRLRLVADLKSGVKVKSFLIPAQKGKKDRLVVDLFHATQIQDVVVPVKTKPKGVRDLVIAIDAGHGGKDPGSIGKYGTHEKQVVLQIAKRVADKINKADGMSAFLIRDNDTKVQYRERMERARRKDADLFMSIHADSFKDSTVSGSSVYVLSQRGASSTAARWLAQKVNSSDLVGGVKLDDKDDVLASVLLDLSQNATIAASTSLGRNVLNELAAIGRVRKNSVQYANFAVLKSPDVPSILVETAYISNPDEERKLKDPKHQNKIATALFKGVRSYFKNNPPPNTLFAQERDARHALRLAAYDMPAVKSSKPASLQTKQPAPEPVKVAVQNKPAVNVGTGTTNSAQTKTPKAKAEQIKAKTEASFQTIKHVIKPGETLSSLSARYNVRLRAIKSLNNLKKDNVRIGQILRIPVIT